MARRGGKALDTLAAGDDDGTGADKTDAGDNLSAHSGYICKQMHDLIQIQICENGYRGAETDQNMRAETSRATLEFSFYADNSPAYDGGNHSHGNGGKTHIPGKIKTGKHRAAPFRLLRWR